MSKKQNGRGHSEKALNKGKNKAKKSGLKADDYDDVDHFHNSKEQVLLSDGQDTAHEDSDEADYNPDTILDLPEASDEDMFESDHDDVEADRGDNEHNDWGRGRKNYYSADWNDKDKGEDEVKEADRIYKKKLASMTAQNYGIAADGPARNNKVVVKSVTFESEEDEEAKEQIEKSVGDDADIQDELQRSLTEVKEVLQPFMDRMAKGELPTSEGLSFLQTKYNLLLHYCINAVYWIKAKASGKPITLDDHPVLERLVKYRMLIEKMKPLEVKLKHQIDKLLRTAATGSGNTDQESLRPRTELIEQVSEDARDEEGDESGKYRPPKTLSVEMPNERKTRQRSSRIQQELLKEELLMNNEDAPEEEDIDIVKRIGDGGVRLSSLDDAEEDNFVRFQLSKKEKRRLAEQSKIIDGLDDLNDMFDEFDRKRKSTKTAESGSDDEDGRTSNDIREKNTDKKRKPKDARLSPRDSESEIESDAGSEEEHRRSAKMKRDAKRAQKPTHDSKQVRFRDIADMDDPSRPRPASRSIITNRGLTPSRPKDTKNPRVKQRKRFEKANKRLGSFRSVFRSASAPYRGESTGIRTDIVRSHKFT